MMGHRILSTTLRVLIATLVVTYGALSAQVRRDQQGVAVLRQAVSAMGGTSSIAGVTTASFGGDMTIYQNDKKVSKQFATKFRIVDGSIAFRREISDGDGTSTFASGGQRPVFQAPNRKSRRFARHVALASASVELPGVLLLREVANPNCEVVYVAVDPGQPLHVRTVDHTSDLTAILTRHDWYFDPNTFIPIRIVYQSPEVNFPSNVTDTTADYLGFQAVEGVLVPVKIRTYMDGRADSELTINVAQVNVGLAQDFDMPEN